MSFINWFAQKFNPSCASPYAQITYNSNAGNSGIINNKKLKVIELSSEKKQDVVKMMNVWTDFANAKASQSSLVVNTEIFKDSFNICTWIKNSVNNSNKICRVFVCFQEEQNIQAIAIVTNAVASSPVKDIPYLYVDYLATHPRNIRSALNEKEPNRVTGAGSKLISHLVNKVCKKENLEEVRLQSLDSAREFYKKMGFANLTGQSILFLKAPGNSVAA